MPNIRDSHLPILAWRWMGDHYILISDDQPVGQLRPGDEQTEASFGDEHWIFQKAVGGTLEALDKASGNRVAEGRMSRHNGKDQGEIRIGEGDPFLFFRNGVLIPPLTTVRDQSGWPLLQYREEASRRGRIQIDNFSATSHKDFPLVVLFGLYLGQMANSLVAR